MLLALPLTMTLAALEWWRFRGTGKVDARNSLTSLILGGAYVLLSEGVMVLVVVLPGYEWLWQYRSINVALTPLSTLALFLLVDFCFYLFHLTAHRVRFFWAVHEVHHGSEHFNFTVAFRQSPLYAVTGVYLFFAPAVLLGFEAEWC